MTDMNIIKKNYQIKDITRLTNDYCKCNKCFSLARSLYNTNANKNYF